MKRLFEFAGYSVPDHLKLFQMTDNPDVPGCHIYMEAQIFLLTRKGWFSIVPHILTEAIRWTRNINISCVILKMTEL